MQFPSLVFASSPARGMNEYYAFHGAPPLLKWSDVIIECFCLFLPVVRRMSAKGESVKPRTGVSRRLTAIYLPGFIRFGECGK